MKYIYDALHLPTSIYLEKPDNNKPFPIRLGELKPPLQQEALDNDRSLHYWIKKILKSYLDGKKIKNDRGKSPNNS